MITNITDRERELRCAVADLQAENKNLQSKLAQQAAMVEKCMVAMNENADRGEKAEAKLAALEKAVTKTHTCKGRYHMQLAMCDLYDLLGLKNERPTKDTYAAAGAAPVPEGWQLVPVGPTPEMLGAMQSSGWLPGCYKAMLAAAPKEAK